MIRNRPYGDSGYFYMFFDICLDFIGYFSYFCIRELNYLRSATAIIYKLI